MKYTLHCFAETHQKNKDIKRLNIKGQENIGCANTNGETTGVAGLATKFQARRFPGKDGTSPSSGSNIRSDVRNKKKTCSLSLSLP